MEQEKIEERVREIFEEQEFKVEKSDNKFTAVKNDLRKQFQVFSSELYDVGEIKESVQEGSIIFVDEELSDIQEELENEVSVIRQRNERYYDLPSYELIGDIAVINDLAGRDGEETVEGILHHHPGIETILLKEKSLGGEFRVGDYKRLYGDETETVHKEFGCSFKVDPTKVYFSERFSTERKRITEQIEEGESVLVMFAGVGPFAVLAAEKADKVLAVEKNPAACNLLEENIQLNKVADTVESMCGDAEDVVPEVHEKFDRIIMPLPESASDYLDIAIDSLTDKGTIHLYCFVENEDFSPVEREVDRVTQQKNAIYKIIDKALCGNRSPSKDRYCFDLEITKHN